MATSLMQESGVTWLDDLLWYTLCNVKHFNNLIDLIDKIMSLMGNHYVF